MIDVEHLATAVVDTSLRIHRQLGPGLLETVYETVLAKALEREGYRVTRQVPISIEFEELHFEAAFRIDILVEDALIVEVKSLERLSPVHAKQLLTYLRLTGRSLGLLVNFGGETLKEGVRRIVNNHPAFVSSRLRVNQNNRSE